MSEQKLKINRVIAIVLDSVGAGWLPDASEFGDEGANTLAHVAEAMNGLNVPNMQKLGLGNILPLKGVSPVSNPQASWGLMSELSKGKDTMAGHWEMMGLIVSKPFPTFPQGFSDEILNEFYKLTGYTSVLGNKAASGTEIIKELGNEHIRTHIPIVYTSADSVFQVAAHEDVIPIPQLYDICAKARVVCDKYQIGRVIARPFIGENGNFTRTANRKDFPMIPSGETALDILKKNGFNVMGIGKIEDIYAGQGITRAIHTKNNADGMKTLLEELSITKTGFIFVNLVDFDMVFGHRNDAIGYGKAIEEFDRGLGELLTRLTQEDLLIITADHGCDPTYPGTDHTREYVPLLVYSKQLSPVPLGIRDTFADIGATVLGLFRVEHTLPGTMFV